MNKTNKTCLSDNLAIVLKEMCSRVDADFYKIDFMSANWFQKYTWTQIEENLFIAWLVGTLLVNKEMRQEIMAFPRKDKKSIEKFASDFVYNFGWKIKD
jgi:hypothetical protein